MAWDEKNRDEWAKQFLERLGPERLRASLGCFGMCWCRAQENLQGDSDPAGGHRRCHNEPRGRRVLPTAPCSDKPAV